MEQLNTLVGNFERTLKKNLFFEILSVCFSLPQYLMTLFKGVNYLTKWSWEERFWKCKLTEFLFRRSNFLWTQKKYPKRQISRQKRSFCALGPRVSFYANEISTDAMLPLLNLCQSSVLLFGTCTSLNGKKNTLQILFSRWSFATVTATVTVTATATGTYSLSISFECCIKPAFPFGGYKLSL